MTIWQGYWREDSTTIWLQLTFLTTSEICSFELSLLANHESPTSWVSGTCKAWGCGLQIKEVLWWFSLRQRKNLVGSSRSYVMVKDWLWESPRKQKLFWLLWGCPRLFLGVSCTCRSSSRIHSTHLHAKHIWVRVYSVGIRFIVCSFLSGFLGNGTASLWELFTLTRVGNLFELEGAVVFITFMNVPVLQGVESVFCPVVTGSGKDRAGITLQLWNGQSFRRNHAKGFLFVFSVSLFNAFVL